MNCTRELIWLKNPTNRIPTNQLLCLAVFVRQFSSHQLKTCFVLHQTPQETGVGIGTKFALYHVKPLFVTAAGGYTKLKKACFM